MDKGSNITGSKAGITVAVMLAALMAVLDITIVNVALNDIRARFGTPLDQIGWVSTGYMMANIVVIPMTGWFQRRFGFRKYLDGLDPPLHGRERALRPRVEPAVARRSSACSRASAAARSSRPRRAILFARYPKRRARHGRRALRPRRGHRPAPRPDHRRLPHRRGRAGTGSSSSTCRSASSPRTSRCATSRSPASSLRRKRSTSPASGSSRWAWRRSSTCSRRATAKAGSRTDTIIALSAIAAISLITFVVHELETEHPVVDLRVFTNRSYAAGTGINFLIGLALFSGSYLFSLYCGAVLHYTALDIGLDLPRRRARSRSSLMPLVGRFGGKIDGRLLVAAGVLLVVVLACG